MPYANLHPEFTDADLALAKQDLQQCIDRLPFLVNLTPKEKKTYLKLGANSVPFIQKALSYYQNYPNLRVDYVALAEWENDLAVMRRLQGLQILVDFLYEAVEDTVIALKQKNMSSALILYNNVKKAATVDVPGTNTIFEDMKKHFPALKVNRKKPAKATK